MVHNTSLYREQLTAKEIHILNIKYQMKSVRIEEQLKSPKWKRIKEEIESGYRNQVCSKSPNALWHRKKHVVCLPLNLEFKVTPGH